MQLRHCMWHEGKRNRKPHLDKPMTRLLSLCGKMPWSFALMRPSGSLLPASGHDRVREERLRLVCQDLVDQILGQPGKRCEHHLQDSELPSRTMDKPRASGSQLLWN